MLHFSKLTSQHFLQLLRAPSHLFWIPDLLQRAGITFSFFHADVKLWPVSHVLIIFTLGKAMRMSPPLTSSPPQPPSLLPTLQPPWKKHNNVTSRF